MEQDRRGILDGSETNKMCSLNGNEAGEMCSPADADTRRDLCVATTKSYVEILNFRHFAKHFVFSPEGKNSRDKHLKNYFDVSVVVDIGCGNTTN